MGRALKVGDYVKLSKKGVTVFGAYEGKLLRITDIGYHWPGVDINRLAYQCEYLLEGGGAVDLGHMYRSEIRLFRPKKKDLPKIRMTFNRWMEEKTNATI